jgi:hypothetical protein
MKDWSQTAHKLQTVLFRDSSTTSVIPVVSCDSAENQWQPPTYQQQRHQQLIIGKANNLNIAHKVCQKISNAN